MKMKELRLKTKSISEMNTSTNDLPSAAHPVILLSAAVLRQHQKHEQQIILGNAPFFRCGDIDNVHADDEDCCSYTSDRLANGP